jgi:hypothetical protein
MMVNGSGSRDGKQEHNSEQDFGAAGYDEDDAEQDDEEFQESERAAYSSGRKVSKDDLQDLAKTSSELLRRTLLSGIDIVRDVGKELPKEATQFLAARREQVLQNVSKDVIQHLVNASIDRLFKTVREHKIEMSFRIVKDAPKDPAVGGGSTSGQGSGTKRKAKKI